MSDSEKQEKSTDGNQYTALGIVFGSVGVTFMITMDSAAIGLPFIALGIAFFVMGIKGVKKAGRPDGDDPAPKP
jgi:sulfite exporter TauE/SafE